ncbi:hypothetical protein HDU98_007978 [Podochytrium sp. JEL0797]|nr:hypothetical protein HDU98_007978 [Podochytrium sp. JEL0797]
MVFSLPTSLHLAPPLPRGSSYAAQTLPRASSYAAQTLPRTSSHAAPPPPRASPAHLASPRASPDDDTFAPCKGDLKRAHVDSEDEFGTMKPKRRKEYVKRVKKATEGTSDSKDPKYCLSDQQVVLDGHNYQIVYRRPPASYADLITYALAQQHCKQLKLHSIYSFLISTFGYFKYNPQKEGWKNSIRHNLSMKSKCRFRKLKGTLDAAAKGCFWSINPDAPHYQDCVTNAWETAEKLETWRGVLYYKLPEHSLPLAPSLFSDDELVVCRDLFAFDAVGGLARFNVMGVEPVRPSLFGVAVAPRELPTPRPPLRNLIVATEEDESDAMERKDKRPRVTKYRSLVGSGVGSGPVGKKAGVGKEGGDAEEARGGKESSGVGAGNAPPVVELANKLGGMTRAVWDTSDEDTAANEDDEDSEVASRISWKNPEVKEVDSSPSRSSQTGHDLYSLHHLQTVNWTHHSYDASLPYHPHSQHHPNDRYHSTHHHQTHYHQSRGMNHHTVGYSTGHQTPCDLFNEISESVEREPSLLFGSPEQNTNKFSTTPLIHMSSIDLEKLLADPSVLAATSGGDFHQLNYY